MKEFFKSGFLLGCILATLLATERIQAQGFGLLVTPSTNQITLTNSLTFSVIVTNNTGTNLADVIITNIPFGIEQLLSVTNVPGLTNSQGLNYYTNGGALVFDFGPLVNGSNASVLFTVQPLNAGLLTNLFQVKDLYATNTAVTNIITQVISAESDLSVAINLPLSTVINNDYTYFTLSVTNLGSASVPNVILTNTLALGLYWFGTWPTNLTYGTNDNTLTQIYNLGTLAPGAFTNITYEVQPTNTGTFTVQASVGAPSFIDSNISNNFATASLVVTNYTPLFLFAFTNSAQNVNYQNGLVEQGITVDNPNSVDVSALRVVVSGLVNSKGVTLKQLANAVGTNFGDPFVTYNGTLPANSTMNLLLQYAPRGPFAFNNSQLHVYALSAARVAPAAATSTSTNLNINRIIEMSNGNMLLEFPATLEHTYTVVYSDNVLFSNAQIALPPIIAHANEVQWIDYGPPTTLSVPSNAPQRFYRIYSNP